MKENDYIKEFESRFTGKRDKSKKMDIYPSPRSSHPLVIEYEDEEVGCIYLHYERGMIRPVVWIMYVRSYEQGKGIGSRILRELCELADQYDVSLYLEPAPDKDSNLNHDELVAWYSKFGFIGHHTMERNPTNA